MARHCPALLAWLTWLLVFSSWVIMLGSVGALQRNCDGASADVIGSSVDYLAPVTCDKLYRYAWWTTWYQFAMTILIPVLLALGWVHRFRLGLVGLLIPIIMLLMHTTNNFYMLWNVSSATPPVSGGLASRSKAMFAGALIGSVADFLMVILVGVHDEKVNY